MLQVSSFYEKPQINTAEFNQIFQTFVDKVFEQTDKNNLIDEIAMQYDIYYYIIKAAIRYYFNMSVSNVINYLENLGKSPKEIKDQFIEELDMII